ncbi:radical SAM protein [archaeon]|nr:radical SAM protein [archaeon]
MKTVYGPVPSWRLGASLGIDPICQRKICSFDCIYCQLGKTTELTVKRREFVTVDTVLTDLKEALQRVTSICAVTFSGTGEPELASNLGELIIEVRKVAPKDVPVVVLTNSSLMNQKQVRKDLSHADMVVAKLDAPNRQLFQQISQPHPSIDYHEMLDGMRKFKQEFTGKYTLQMMFTQENKNFAREMASRAKEIKPDDIQLDTPIRPSKTLPLTPQEMMEVKKHFNEFNTISVYEAQKVKAKPINPKETNKRRPLK